MTMDAIAKIDQLTIPTVSGAYYAFVRYGGNRTSVDISEDLLTKGKVAVVPGSFFGAGGEGHFRISFAVEEAILTDGLKRLGQFFL